MCEKLPAYWRKLLIGALVALGGVFTAQIVSIALDDRRAQETRSIEERRTQEARSIEAQRAQEAALQRYFEQIGKLVADPDRPLHRSTLGDNLSTVARAQTFSVLQGIDDPARKRILLEFLYESGLIYKDMPVVDLRGAWLFGASLYRAKLREADLNRADLGGAKLSGADLSVADLGGAKLREADLSGADLFEANLSGADLSFANLSGADLGGAYLHFANLSEAKLRGANLSGAKLREAKLREAYRFPADLRETNLVAADLSGAAGITNEDLDQQVRSLDGAAMPDGQRYEDWLKSRGEENSNPS
jgi:uncharacterized protein YjbI with pentapeptide repeats